MLGTRQDVRQSRPRCGRSQRGRVPSVPGATPREISLSSQFGMTGASATKVGEVAEVAARLHQFQFHRRELPAETSRRVTRSSWGTSKTGSSSTVVAPDAKRIN